MTVVKEFFRFFLFIVRPLFFNLNSLLWLSFFLLIFNGINNTITAIRMEIPSIEKVSRISGIFVDTGKHIEEAACLISASWISKG